MLTAHLSLYGLCEETCGQHTGCSQSGHSLQISIGYLQVLSFSDFAFFPLSQM